MEKKWHSNHLLLLFSTKMQLIEQMKRKEFGQGHLTLVIFLKSDSLIRKIMLTNLFRLTMVIKLIISNCYQCPLSRLLNGLAPPTRCLMMFRMVFNSLQVWMHNLHNLRMFIIQNYNNLLNSVLIRMYRLIKIKALLTEPKSR